jgi:outer membrane protein assembly factor BamB
VHSSPALGADSTVYFGSLDSTFYALSTVDGTLKWKRKTGADINGPPALGSDGTVYVGSLDNYLYAFDTGSETGAPASAWPEFGHDSRNSFRAVRQVATGQFKFYFKAENMVSSTPAFNDDGTLYFGSRDHYLYAASPEGILQWKYKAAGPIITSPVLGSDGTVFFGSWNSEFYALNSDGSLKWKLYIPGAIRSTPALSPNGTLYFGHRNKLYAVSTVGRVKWTFEPNDNYNPPAIGRDGTVYYVSGGDGTCLYAVSVKGTLSWKYTLDNETTGGVSIGPDGTIHVAAGDLYAVNPEGTLKWKYEAAGSPPDSFNLTPIVGPDSTVYAAGSGSFLYAVNSDGTLEWSAETGAGAQMPPVLGADGTIYIASKENSVFALNSDGSLKWTKSVGHRLDPVYPTYPALGEDGTLYLGTRDSLLLGIETGTGEGLAVGGWPKVGLNLGNTGSLWESYVPPEKNCDFSGDGIIAIGDVIFFLLLARSDYDDPRLDWNGDGVFEINDAIALLIDIRNGDCPETSLQLASSGNEEQIEKVGGLTAAEIKYLEETILNMPLSPEELSVIRLALYGVSTDAPSLPRAFSLAQNFPNPFNPATTISYEIPAGDPVKVTLQIFNSRGALVRSLVDSERDPGAHTAFWDGTDTAGRKAASGVYFYRITAGEFSRTRKMVLLK